MRLFFFSVIYRLIEEIVDGSVQNDILEKTKLPSVVSYTDDDWILEQDIDPKVNAANTKQWP